MVREGEKELLILKLEHEEIKLFLQLVWGALLSFVVSLLVIAFKEKIHLARMKFISISIITILSGIVISWLIFGRKFNRIKTKIRCVKG